MKTSSPSGIVPPVQDKYKKKLKDLKRRNREIEEENDRLVLKISRARKDVERLRAERSFLFQKLDEFERLSKGEDGSVQDYEGSSSGLRGRQGEDFQDEDDDLDVLDVESFSSRPKDSASSKKSGLTLTLPSSAQAGPKKPEKDPNAPKKHMNAFKVYCQIERAKDRERFSKMSLSDQTRALGAAWKILSVEEKKVQCPLDSLN